MKKILGAIGSVLMIAFYLSVTLAVVILPWYIILHFAVKFW